MTNIIFLLGVPRSGSTLLQRLIAAHDDVNSTAEPWLLLPLMTCFDSSNNLSTYSHLTLEGAIQGLASEYPNLHIEYQSMVRDYVLKVYGDLSGGKKYFLDKTPRYYLIANQLKEVFPESKFIYLYRNPIDIIDSTLKTFCSNRLYRLPYCYYDLTEGLNLLTRSLSDESDNQIIINYERLCSNPEKELEHICDFLDIDFHPTVINDFLNVKFKGALGDPNRSKHNNISAQSANTPLSYVRKRIYYAVLNNVNNDAIQYTMFDREQLTDQIKYRKNAGMVEQIVDLFDYFMFKLIMFFGLVTVHKVIRKKRFSRKHFLS